MSFEVSSILPKNKRNISALIDYAEIRFLVLFLFGRIEDTICPIEINCPLALLQDQAFLHKII